jgi:hypothetical protein
MDRRNNGHPCPFPGKTPYTYGQTMMRMDDVNVVVSDKGSDLPGLEERKKVPETKRNEAD